MNIFWNSHGNKRNHLISQKTIFPMYCFLSRCPLRPKTSRLSDIGNFELAADYQTGRTTVIYPLVAAKMPTICIFQAKTDCASDVGVKIMRYALGEKGLT
ncbi:hypothetical protein CEXT_792891 [Caerostris extrusa]|uniref:Uncharacterized protein n=1 Tax=Caerostris extrusa TaxID=172846 RepID=A0AAV4MIF5_CAEEX|nr:hypothetical protein CEXT_792891 [Caerostris extrusa]